MSTCAIYYGDFISEENKIYPSKSFTMTRGNDKLCDEILSKREITKNIEGKTLIARLYELENSPHHPPILGFVDIFTDDRGFFFSRVTLSDYFLDNEGLYADLESEANNLTLKIQPKVGFCSKI